MTNAPIVTNIEFQPDDFVLKGAENTKLDMNFSSQRFWKDNSFPCPFWTDNSRGGKGIA